MANKQIAAYRLTKEALNALDGFYNKKYTDRDRFFLLGEIEQAPGHGVFIALMGGEVLTMLHMSDFEKIPYDDF